MTDQVQNARLDQLERTIRGLSAELVAERRLVSELRRDTIGNGEVPMRRHIDERVEYEAAPRQDHGLPAALSERLSLIERSVEARFGDIASGWTVSAGMPSRRYQFSWSQKKAGRPARIFSSRSGWMGLPLSAW